GDSAGWAWAAWGAAAELGACERGPSSEQAADVVDRHDEEQGEQGEHAVAVDHLLDPWARAPPCDRLVAQEAEAAPVEWGQREQVEHAEQRADERGHLDEVGDASLRGLGDLVDDVDRSRDAALHLAGDEHP